MPITPRYRRVPYGQKAAPETGYTCPICGEDVVWWDEPYEKDGNLVYHSECRIQERDDCD